MCFLIEKDWDGLQLQIDAYLNSEGSGYLFSKFTVRKEITIREIKIPDDLIIPRCRTNQYKHSFIVADSSICMIPFPCCVTSVSWNLIMFYGVISQKTLTFFVKNRYSVYMYPKWFYNIISYIFSSVFKTIVDFSFIFQIQRK